MTIETIRFFSRNEEVESKIHPIESRDENKILGLRKEYRPCLFVIKTDDIQIFRVFGEIIIDRGIKHQKIPLARYMLGQKKIPLINSDFRSPAQIPRSIRALLQKAHQQDDKNIYLIGVDNEIFDILKDAVSNSNELKIGQFENIRESSDLLEDKEHKADLLENMFLGNSDQACKIRSFITCAAESDDEVLILGETGTGKEVIAKAIHLLKFGNLGNMQVINCAAISESLLESELFGYRKGAFTGADRDRKGLWEISQDGTLFLDEIGDLTPGHQAKILRALAEKKIRPVGSSHQVGVNARIIAATNVDLVSRVKSREFRDDLYYRLNTFPIFVPPLRDRKEDITVLASTFWNDITPEHVPPLNDDVYEILGKRDWPGNVRVLHSFLRCLRTLNHETLSKGKPITVKDLHFAFAYHGQQNVLPQPGVSSDEVSLHPAHCLRRLKRVSDIFFSIRFAITRLLEGQGGNEIHRDSILNNIRELQMLCKTSDAALFHSVPTFNEVHGCAVTLNNISEELFTAPNNHTTSWIDVSENLSWGLKFVFDEIERITS